jgi:hypothetical protein
VDQWRRINDDDLLGNSKTLSLHIFSTQDVRSEKIHRAFTNI